MKNRIKLRGVWLLVFGSLIIAGSGCGDSEEAEALIRPQLLVTIDADDAVREEMASIHFRVYADSAGSSRPVQAVYESIYDIVEDDAEWPRVFAVAPRDGELSRRYRVEARAHREPAGAGTIAMVQSWTGGYIDAAVVPIVLYLAGPCIGVSCEDVNETCYAGSCVPSLLSEELLASSCEEDMECAPKGECAIARCLHGRCVDSLEPSLCNDGELCSYNEGCLPAANRFACGDGETLPLAKVCDGTRDCLSGLDEANCTPFEWTCADGDGTIPLAKLCDGSQDCADGSDERDHCPSAPYEGLWFCGGDDESAIIPKSLLCDGFENCPNGADEGSACVRDAGVFVCEELSLPIERLCDGTIDCPNGFDEEHCSQ